MTGLGTAVGRLRRTVLGVLVVVAVAGAGLTGLQVLEARPVAKSLHVAVDADSLVVCSGWASPSGSDATGDGTVREPFRSAQRLVRSLPPGTTGCLRGGRYVGDVTMVRDRTTLRSAPGERAVLQLETLSIPLGVDGVTISHLDVVGGGDALTVRAVGDGFTLRRNDITNREAGASCVLVGASDHRTVRGAIVDNVIHGCGRDGNRLDHGIYAQNVGPAGDDPTGLLIEGNVLHDVASYAVQLYPEAVGAVVRGNVIDGGGRSVRGGVVLDGPVSVGHLIEGNAIARTRTGAVVQRTGRGHVSRGNCFWDNADDVSGPSIQSSGDRGGEACWLPQRLWDSTGADAAQEPCVCPDRVTSRCSAQREAALCRWLKQSKEEQ